MARGRMISNSIAQDKRINQLSDDTSRLAYTWLITFADCEGRTLGDPAVLRSMLFPRREDITIAQMEGYIREWNDLGLIVWYEAKDDMWIYFPAFFNHNRVNKDHEATSKIPEPPPDKIQTKINLTPDKITLNLNQVKSIQDNDAAAVFTAYSNNIGTLTPMLADDIGEAITEYTGDWIIKAIEEAVTHNARNWKYIHAILKRWKVDGIGSNDKPKNDVKKIMHMDKLVDPRDIGYVLHEGKWIDPRSVPTEIIT